MADESGSARDRGLRGEPPLFDCRLESIDPSRRGQHLGVFWPEPVLAAASFLTRMLYRRLSGKGYEPVSASALFFADRVEVVSRPDSATLAGELISVTPIDSARVLLGNRIVGLNSREWQVPQHEIERLKRAIRSSPWQRRTSVVI